MVPLWTSKDSAGESILTMQPAGRSQSGESTSIIDLALSVKMRSIFLVETGMTGFLTAFNNARAAKLNLYYGIKLKICRSVQDKSKESRDTESNVIVFLKHEKAYSKFIKLWNRAAVEHFYWYPRIDSNVLREFWDDEGLMLAFPFYSSFIARNYLSLSECIVDFGFTNPLFFIEESGLPFDEIIARRLRSFTTNNSLRLVPARSIYYEKYSDLESAQIMRCIKNRTSLDCPNLEHFSSNRFCFEDFLNEIDYERT